MLKLLKKFLGLLRRKRVTKESIAPAISEPEPRKPWQKGVIPLRADRTGIYCVFCGERMPDFMEFPGIHGPYIKGFEAGMEDQQIGANPHWQDETKNCFALAGWNLGWLHAVSCGNKNESPVPEKEEAR